MPESPSGNLRFPLLFECGFYKVVVTWVHVSDVVLYNITGEGSDVSPVEDEVYASSFY